MQSGQRLAPALNVWRVWRQAAYQAGRVLLQPLNKSRGADCTSHLQGLEKGIDYKKVLKAFKKDFCCNGTVVDDPELGQVRQQRIVWTDAVEGLPEQQQCP